MRNLLDWLVRIYSFIKFLYEAKLSRLKGHYFLHYPPGNDYINVTNNIYIYSKLYTFIAKQCNT